MTERFEFELRPHGAGGFGTVIKGRDNLLERDIAVKVLNPLATKFSPPEQERFRREARILAAMSHPNIPSIYDVDFDEDHFLIIFEFIQGRTLQEIIDDEGPCQLSDVKLWLAQIVSALDHAHRKNIIHRDVKPANIIVIPDRESAYLVDFGIALSAGEAKRITESGYVVGTAGYMSPEQQAGEEIDHRADIFSLAITLYEALAGQRPPVVQYEELAATNEAIPPELDGLILGCIGNRNERPPLKSFTSQLAGALRPSKPLSEVLAHGRLHELAAAIEPYTAGEFVKLPAGQRALILAKVTDIVESQDPSLIYASEQFLNLILTRGMLLDKDEYREIVQPSVRWGFELRFGDRLGKDSIRRTLEEAAYQAHGDAHQVLKEEFGELLRRLDLEEHEGWFLHSLRDVLETLLANPVCISETTDLVKALRDVNRIQRARPSGTGRTATVVE